MQQIIEAICAATDNMYRLGWNERNGGNISVLVDKSEVDYLNIDKVIRTIPLSFCAAALSGRYVIVTGTGTYFKNISSASSACLGVVRISDDGSLCELLWGFDNGGMPTSEFPAHLMTHIERLKVDKNHRVVIHTHATNTVAMTHVHSLCEREFTRTLWRMCTECLVVFPDGVSVLPWMLCGTDEIGRATADKMKASRIVIWSMHGIFGTGRSIDEAFGLIETVEKAAELYMKTAHLPRINTVSDAQLLSLARLFNVTPRSGYLDC